MTMTNDEAVKRLTALCHHADAFNVQVCCGNGRTNCDNTGEDCCGEPYGADDFWQAIAALGPKWLPIEEAPRDGTLHLRWTSIGPVVANEPPNCMAGRWTKDKAMGWSGAGCRYAADATHWQPLPAPPALHQLGAKVEVSDG